MKQETTLKKQALEKLKTKYLGREKKIEARLKDFKKVLKGSEESIFAELAFCVFTPQSSARRCWAAVEELRSSDLLLSDDLGEIEKVLQTRVRFHKTKARRLIRNRKLFEKEGRLKISETLSEFSSDSERRKWLIRNVVGYGWKEASHFLRNVGYCEDIAILDRHILRNLHRYGIISEVPNSLTPKKYVEIESRMKRFCEKHGLAMSHLDLLFWAEETGEIFK